MQIVLKRTESDMENAGEETGGEGVWDLSEEHCKKSREKYSTNISQRDLKKKNSNCT